MESYIRYYPPDVFPSLWEKLDELIEKGELAATEEVLIELGKKDDDVYKWAKDREFMFVPLNEEIQFSLKNILIKYKKLVGETKNRSSADPWVIALAQINNCSVITAEKPRGNLNKPKIPDVCRALNIPCINLLQFFREQNWIFR